MASEVMSPEMMAFVVAIAWMILPAIPLASKNDWVGMWYAIERRFAAAVTKSTAKSSSLSNTAAPSSSFLAPWNVRMASKKTAALSARSQTLCLFPRPIALEALCCDVPPAFRLSSAVRISPRTRGFGFVRDFHRSSMRSTRSMSSWNTRRKIRSAYASTDSPSPRRNTLLSTCSSSSCCPSVSASFSPPSSRSVTVSTLPNSRWNSSSFAHTMQCMGFSGVLRMVQTGKVLGVGFG
mmetsp:Transcript_4544/g.8266  ORF Transcript_4544/g.8266 Transcript_4544/m.8266 type:complete len:237 (-) Transcript_4544:616-1326(-)